MHRHGPAFYRHGFDVYRHATWYIPFLSTCDMVYPSCDMTRHGMPWYAFTCRGIPLFMSWYAVYVSWYTMYVSCFCCTCRGIPCTCRAPAARVVVYQGTLRYFTVTPAGFTVTLRYFTVTPAGMSDNVQTARTEGIYTLFLYINRKGFLRRLRHLRNPSLERSFPFPLGYRPGGAFSPSKGRSSLTRAVVSG